MNAQHLALLLLVPIVAYAQTSSETLLPEERTITFIVADAEGRPIEQAFIEPSETYLFEAVTDVAGRFTTTTRIPAFVVRKYGYESKLVRAESATEFEIVLRRPAAKPTIKPCPAETDCRPFVGYFCFQTMDHVTPSRKIQDHDYAARYYALTGTFGESVILHGSGSNWSPGVPPGNLLYRSIEYEETVLYRKLRASPVVDNSGISEMVWDTRGKTREGKRWRHLGALGESASYNDLTEEDARLLDRVLDSVCLYEKF